MRPYILSENNWKSIRDQSIEVAILPWGATEAHNYHLPYGTDNIETEAIAYDSARIAWEQGAKVIVLPVIPFGVNTGQDNIKLTINLFPSTQAIILDNIIKSLYKQGIYKLLIVNGHGGNDFKQSLRELGNLNPDFFLCSCNWFQVIDRETIFTNGGDHADESETSLMLFLASELVLPLDEAGTGDTKQFKVKALNEKWAWAERKWTQVSTDTGIGNPRLGTRKKGERYFKEITEKIGEFMVDLSLMDREKIFE